MFCYKCGVQNQDDARFCNKCGASIAPGSGTGGQVDYEVCQIECQRNQGLGEYVGRTFTYWADAIGPKGQYKAAELTWKEGGMLTSFSGWGHNSDSPDGSCSQCLEAHRQFIHMLVSDGWQPTQERGFSWYQLRFRRRPKDIETSFRVGQSAEQPRLAVRTDVGQTTPREEIPVAAPGLVAPIITGTWRYSRTVGSIQGRMLMQRHGGSPTAEFKANGTWNWTNDKSHPTRYGIYEFANNNQVSLYYDEDGARSLYGTIQDYSQIAKGIMCIKIPDMGSVNVAWEFRRVE